MPKTFTTKRKLRKVGVKKPWFLVAENMTLIGTESFATAKEAERALASGRATFEPRDYPKLTGYAQSLTVFRGKVGKA